jgi:hypothetical protein
MEKITTSHSPSNALPATKGKGESGGKKNAGLTLDPRPLQSKVGAESGARKFQGTPSMTADLKIERFFTRPGENPLDAIQTTRTSSQIREKDGKVVFEMKDVEAPKGWSQLAIDIAVSKYFRKAGVPQYDDKGNVLKNATNS